MENDMYSGILGTGSLRARDAGTASILSRILLLFALIFASLAGSEINASESGVFPDRIVFGQSAPFSGPAWKIAQSITTGIQIAFDEINSQGGINGRQLELVSEDDSYDPAKTREIIQSFIDSDEIFAIIGSVGTPTARVTAALADRHYMPFIAPWSGAGLLRDKERYSTVVNLRPTYKQEANAWVEYLTGIGIDRIAVFYRDDAYGRVGLRGVVEELRKRGMLLVARGSHARNVTVVSSAVWEIRQSEPQAIGMVTSYRTASDFIRHTRLQGLDPVFINLSVVGAQALVDELGDDAQGIIFSQVMPSPYDQSLPLVVQFTKSVDDYARKNSLDADTLKNYISLEGYLAARFVIHVLQRIDSGEITRKAMLDYIFDSQTFEIGGVKLLFKEGGNQGLHKIYITEIGENNQILTLDSIELEDNS